MTSKMRHGKDPNKLAAFGEVCDRSVEAGVDKAIDLFSGNGNMEKIAVSKGIVVDCADNDSGVWDPWSGRRFALCDAMDFARCREEHDYGLLIIDTYGSPWRYLYEMLVRSRREKIFIYLTEGLGISDRFQTMDKFVKKVSPGSYGIPRSRAVKKRLVDVTKRAKYDLHSARFVDATGRTNKSTQPIYIIAELRRENLG